VHLPRLDSVLELAEMTSGAATASLGRRYRNCSRARIVYLAQGAEILIDMEAPARVDCALPPLDQWQLGPDRDPRHGQWTC
jgi:hypothetical protein